MGKSKLPLDLSESYSKHNFSLHKFLESYIQTIHKELSIDIQLEKDSCYYLKLVENNIPYKLIITNKIIDYWYNTYNLNNSKETVGVFYLFNYFNLEQLEKSITSFIKEIILKDSLESIKGKDGYYNIKYSKHTLIRAYDLYIPNSSDKFQYYYFKEMATRKQVIRFNESLHRVISKLKNLDIEIIRSVQSDESEAYYLHIKHKKTNKQMKITVRNHPVNTKCQLCFYLSNYTSLEELENTIYFFLKEFDWSKYVFNINNYMDVLPKSVINKEFGDDLALYTKKQVKFMKDNKLNKELDKLKKKGIVGTISNLTYLH